MFVCVARVSLDIPAAGSLKAKRQVLRKVTDRVKAKFNVSSQRSKETISGSARSSRSPWSATRRRS